MHDAMLLPKRCETTLSFNTAAALSLRQEDVVLPALDADEDLADNA